MSDVRYTYYQNPNTFFIHGPVFIRYMGNKRYLNVNCPICKCDHKYLCLELQHNKIRLLLCKQCSSWYTFRRLE